MLPAPSTIRSRVSPQQEGRLKKWSQEADEEQERGQARKGGRR